MNLDPNLIIFYVDDLTKTRNFYEDLLESEPLESFPDFAMFNLKNGLRLGLWTKQSVDPAIDNTGNGFELVFQVPENKLVDEMHTTWRDKNITIIQAPTTMDFGYTFLAIDPDKNRLRVYAFRQAN
jgi:predicted enzyme related to lactoylglutathione lyase